MDERARNPVQSVERTFEVIRGLQELGGAGVTELSAHLDVPKSTVHNYLSTLEQESYVVKSDGEYRVGLRFLEHGVYAREGLPVYDIARPELDRLARETGELANLMVAEGGVGVYLYRARGDSAVSVKEHVGTRVPLHTTALGKAILAYLPDGRVDGIVDQHGLDAATDRTITGRGELDAALEDVREQGVAFDDEERLPGLRCVAAPLRSDDGRVLGAISVSGPSHRLDDDRLFDDLREQVLETANVIELNVTYS